MKMQLQIVGILPAYGGGQANGIFIQFNIIGNGDRPRDWDQPNRERGIVKHEQFQGDRICTIVPVTDTDKYRFGDILEGDFKFVGNVTTVDKPSANDHLAYGAPGSMLVIDPAEPSGKK